MADQLYNYLGRQALPSSFDDATKLQTQISVTRDMWGNPTGYYAQIGNNMYELDKDMAGNILSLQSSQGIRGAGFGTTPIELQSAPTNSINASQISNTPPPTIAPQTQPTQTGPDLSDPRIAAGILNPTSTTPTQTNSVINPSSSQDGQIYRDLNNNFYYNGEHINLDQFHQLGINETFVKPGETVSLNQAKTGQNASSMIDNALFDSGQIPQLDNMSKSSLSDVYSSLQSGGSDLNSILNTYLNSQKNIENMQTQYLNSLKALNQGQANYQAGVNKIEGQTIPMDFIQGQQAGLQRQYQAQRANDLAALGLQEQAINLAEQNAEKPLQFYRTMLDTQKTQAEINKLNTEANNKTKSYQSGIIGEYEYAKDHGYKGSFIDYQNEDANRKRPITNILNNGLDAKTATRVQQIAGQFDNEQVIKNYNIISEGYQFAKNLNDNTTSSADDQGLIYAFAKAMDPNSVVREGEYATVQKYAQSWKDSYGFNVQRILSNKEFLTPQARKNMKSTIASRYKASEQNYKNVYAEYGRRINKITGQNDGLEYITDYSQAYKAGNSPVDRSTIQSDIYNAIKDKEHFPNRETLIQALAQHYGITTDEAAKKVYSVWTDNTPR